MLRRMMLIAVLGLGCGGPGGRTGGEPGKPPGTDAPPASYASSEELMADAPPQRRPQGSAASIGGASFLVPPGYTATVYEDGVAARSPKDAEGWQCEIFVLQPRPMATGELPRNQQLLDAAASLFPEGTQFEGPYLDADLTRTRWRGTTGRGWDSFGLDVLTVDGFVDVLPFGANFGGTLVPVVVIEPRPSEAMCLDSADDLSMAVVTVYHSLQLEGASAGETQVLAEQVVGKWSSTTSTTHIAYIFGANGNYIDSATVGGEVQTSPGEWTDAYATWSGNGSYVVRGEVLGLFPNDDAAQSHFIRLHEVHGYDDVWTRMLCMVGDYEGSPYSLCLDRQEQ